jgi:hypothetical protein
VANLALGRAALDAAVRQAFAARELLSDWPAERMAGLVRDRYDNVAWTERTG